MKTSMAYRLFRLYFNSNSDNYQVFGNRVYNPINGTTEQTDSILGAVIRAVLVAAILGLLFYNV